VSTPAAALRLLFISNLWPPAVVGGAERYGHDLAAQLVGRGHEVKVLTLGVPGPEVIGQVRPWPYRPDAWRSQSAWRRWLYHIGDLGRPGVAATIRRVIRDYEPDLVHSHTVTGMTMAALTVPGSLGVPHVHTLHDYWLVCTHSNLLRRDGTACGNACLTAARIRRAARRPLADALIAPSQAVFDVHAQRGLTFDGVATAVLPVPPDVPAGPPRRPPSGPPVFGYLGQLNLNKGVATLVDAFGRADIAGARLLLAGRGMLTESIRARGVQGVELLGWVEGAEREEFFAGIDCLVVCSEWPEPGAMVVAEAKARGLPVIGTAIGCLPEVVPASCRPLLAPIADPDALARSLRSYADDPTAYVVGPGDVRIDRSVHLDGVLGVYLDALTACRTGPRGSQGGNRRRPKPDVAASTAEAVRRP
jgi:glycosyltransferase involved in cell wall biosynthesis